MKRFSFSLKWATLSVGLLMTCYGSHGAPIKRVSAANASAEQVDKKMEQNDPEKAPLNQPAKVRFTGTQLEIIYNNAVIFRGKLDRDAKEVHIWQVEDKNPETGGITQVIKLEEKDGGELQVRAVMRGSESSFPCAIDRPETEGEAAKIGGTDIVRSSIGLSHSLLNRAVYDRKYDWVFSADPFCQVVIVPQKESAGGNEFNWTVSGRTIIFKFRPIYYQKHRGLKYFKPWTYALNKPPVVGWCSWFAFMDKVTEQDVHQAADLVSKKLKPYGFNYIQIDDGYQQPAIRSADSWLKTNAKFPSGLGALAAYIHSKGLIPGIWNNVSFQGKDSAEANKGLFVLDENGHPAKGNWVGYIMDGSNPKTIDKYIRPVFDGFKDMGWQYFKVDALRHLRYEGYNSNAAYFEKKNVDRTEAYRKVMEGIREEVGSNNFINACWGIRPEFIGLVDACRIGTDGYFWQELAQYNSFNNIVWQNDPDHIQLTTKYAYRDCMLTSMTGSLFMLTDKPSFYESGNIEPAIRSTPVIRTLPGQIYDVDPSRSNNLDQVNQQMSGAGARPFDANCHTPYDLFLEEVNLDYENYVLLGRVGENEKIVSFSALGLDPKQPYLVFDFWHKTLTGQFTGSFQPENIDTTFNCQLFCIRAKQDHPQLMATNRHITCGALEVKNITWEDGRLAGVSEGLPAGDVYVLYINEGKGNLNQSFKTFKCSGADYLGATKKGSIREIRLKPKSAMVEWEVLYN